jgi:hypothetical protein
MAFSFYDMILKYNPYHDARGRFTSGSGAASFSLGGSKTQRERAVARETERTAGMSGGTASQSRQEEKPATVSAAVIAMCGKEGFEEFDTPNKPNKYGPDDPRWGTEPGEYTVYRTGGLDRDVIFTANKFDGASSYTTPFPSGRSVLVKDADYDPERLGVNSYTVTIKKPFVAKNLNDAYETLYGEKVNLDPSDAQKRKGVTTGDLWVKADNKITKTLKSKGYDAWTMTNPAPPAEKEMNILSKGNMKKTSRKVPKDVKERLEKEVAKDGYYANAYKNGKQIMDIDQWFKTDKYRQGKAEGKWN